MRYFCFIFFLLGALKVSAQQEITGKVTDERNMPLPGATVTLKLISEAKISAYAIADAQGDFSLKQVKAGNYRIEAAFVTYKNEARSITVGKGAVEVQLFKLLAETRQLQEVTINGKKQAISVSTGKTTMNVEQSNLAQSQSAFELLKSLPGVNINKDGEIRIKGKSGVTVMIDGEPAEMGSSQLKALLKGTPGTTLQSIEVMNNPPSSMDAAGTAGVINIIFKKKVKKGFNGTISSNVSKGRYYRTNQSLNMTYGTEKWNLNLLYAYDFDHSRNRDSMFRSQNIPQPFYMSQLQLNPQKSKGHLLKLGLDHHFDEKNSLRFNLSFNDINSPTDGRTISRFGAGTVQDSLLDQRNELRNTTRNWDYGLKFRHKFTELKSLNASLQFNNLNSRGSEDYTIFKTLGRRPDLSELRYRNIYPSKIDRKTIKIDYLQELKKGDQQLGKFEAGIKSAQTNLNNSQFSENRKDGVWQNDALRNNNFRYKEAIQAAYATMELKLEPWTFNAGLRGEYTRVRGEAGTDPSLVCQNYFSLFPNALIGYKLNDKYTLSVSYSRRIERPDYDQLNPAVRYLDLYTTQQGNPKLKPQFSNNIELNQQFFSFIDLTLGYSSTKNPIFSTFLSSPGAKSAYTTINTGHQQQWEASLSFPIPGVDWWENYQSIYFYTSQFNANLETKAFKESANTYGFYSYNSFKLPAGFNLELSGWYQSAGLYGNFRYKPVSEIITGINKKMLNDKLTLGLAVADVFYTGIFKAAVLSDHTQTFNLDSRTDSRQVKFSLSWNFGKKRKAESPAEQPSDEDRLPADKGKRLMKPGKQ
ncbi:hypothetical protein DBR43_19640 [Pedobacter sp. KBW06]|uniref:TonB-dependent receptor domain-containing protein n=1 Tax=Pedobacter sp. KBW06 TaxID=2153359 RepID=UPI000F5A1905|nr:TonB-dependent receptor [Pedobacter sp. KBW06]RQO70242.1 hypothetical protein DBR43_19640 [Pedobacter sp. KBW06]